MKNRKKIVISVLLSFIFIFSWIMNENVFAAGKVKLNKKVATVTVGDTLKLKISGTKKKIKNPKRLKLKIQFFHLSFS